MKILILVQWYPPDIKVPARRWGNLVAGIQKQGIECTVISAGDGFFTSYTGKSGEQVIRLSISNKKKKKKVVPVSRCKKNVRQKIVNLLKKKIIPPGFRNRSVNEWFDQLDNYPEIIEIAHKHDFIISSYGPMGPFLLGRWLARKSGRPWIADIRDSFESKEINNVSAYNRISSRLIERYILCQASIRVTIGSSLAKYLTKKYGVEFHTIYNGWTETDRLQKRIMPINGKKYLFYAGSIYAHQIPALQIVLDSLKKYPDIYLKIRLLSDNSNGAFSSFIDQEGFSEKVEVLPKTSPETVNAELAESIGALVIEEIGTGKSFSNATVTGKLLGLLVSGAPGISVSLEGGEIRKILNETEGWYGVNTVSQFCNALELLMNNFQGRIIKNNIFLSRYNMDEQSKILVELLRN